MLETKFLFIRIPLFFTLFYTNFGHLLGVVSGTQNHWTDDLGPVGKEGPAQITPLSPKGIPEDAAAVAKIPQSAAESRRRGRSQPERSERRKKMVRVATYFAMTFGAFLFWQSMDRVHVWIALHQDEKVN